MSDKHAAFVADGQIPPSPPPSTDTGALGWPRENLFSGPVNSVLTIVSIALILWIVPGIIQWAFIDAVWVADSLEGCRADQRDGRLLGGDRRAFRPVHLRLLPVELRWRPNLAFLLLLVALAYVLFDNMPFRRVGLVFAAIYPVLGYLLIWGGSIWGPLLILATAASSMASSGWSRASPTRSLPSAPRSPLA